MSNYFPCVIILAPLVAALLSARRGYKIGWWALVVGFAASLPTLWQAIQSPDPTRIVLFVLPWKLLPAVELSIDRLAAVMMFVISGIGALLYRYSTRYLQQDSGHRRYQILLVLAISSLLLMVCSADLVTLFVAWQLLSWLLCLLSHNYAHESTARSSFRTFIMLRAGDIAFLAGIVLAYHLYGTLEFSQLFERAAADQTQFALFGSGLKIQSATLIALLIFIGAMSKSAQFPLHMWLPDSLYAPTPIHALLHAGIINAGGFLLNRLAPLYALSPTTLHVVFVVGLVTALLGTSMMLVQNDIKKTLGYSTIGQMGYMIMECGLGAFSLAVFHLIAHGLFKATIFLNCGDVIHQARLEPARPAKLSAAQPGASALSWVAAFVVSFLLPLGITFAAHRVLGIPLDSQGLLIFLIFSWVTASQAVLTLFRVGKAKSIATLTGMLLAVALVSTAYLFAAEQFTHFLYPDPTVVTAYLRAAALPSGLFLAVAAMLVLMTTVGWFLLYGQKAGPRAPRSGWLRTRAYLFFINRLYLDAFALRLFNAIQKVGRAIDRSRIFFLIIAAVAIALAWRQMPHQLVDLKGTAVALPFLALLLPLFPLHGLYITALTRTPRMLTVALAFVLPLIGIYGLSAMLPTMPPQLLSAAGVLAAFGALWGSVKALVQDRVSKMLGYGGLALYSVLWWHIAQAGGVTPDTMRYAYAVTLAIGGLVLAWDRIRARYGDLDLNHIGGLFTPMPRFALCTALLVMAAVGLPPFGLFFGYLGILLSPSTTLSLGLVVVLIAWFAASWFFFTLMRRLLFGPHRTDIKYEDLGPLEIAALGLVLCLLVAIGAVPGAWL